MPAAAGTRSRHRQVSGAGPAGFRPRSQLHRGRLAWHVAARLATMRTVWAHGERPVQFVAIAADAWAIAVAVGSGFAAPAPEFRLPRPQHVRHVHGSQQTVGLPYRPSAIRSLRPGRRIEFY